MMQLFFDYYFNYIMYFLFLMLLVVISFIPFKYNWVASAGLRLTIVLGTAYILVTQIGSDMMRMIVRGSLPEVGSLFNVTLVIAINNIAKAISDVVEEVLKGFAKRKEG